MKPLIIDELSLIRSAQQGDLDAFNELILAYQGYLFRIACNILGDEDSASDAVQEALISAFRSLGSFRGTVLRSWLTRMVINACYDQLRRQRRHPSIPLEHADELDEEMEPSSWLTDDAPLPEMQVEARQLQSQIQAGLKKLAPRYMEAAILVDIEGLSYDEAAQILRVPVGTVKSRLARARLALRHLLVQPQPAVPGGVAFDHNRIPLREYA